MKVIIMNGHVYKLSYPPVNDEPSFYIGQRETTPELSENYYGRGKKAEAYIEEHGIDNVKKYVKKDILIRDVTDKKLLNLYEEWAIASQREVYGRERVWNISGKSAGSGEGKDNYAYGTTKTESEKENISNKLKEYYKDKKMPWYNVNSPKRTYNRIPQAELPIGRRGTALSYSGFEKALKNVNSPCHLDVNLLMERYKIED